MTWTGRGDPSLTEPVPIGRTRRQGSVSSAELLGLERARPRGPWRGMVFLVLVMGAVIIGGATFAGPRLRDMAFDVARSNPQAMRLPMVPGIVRERLGASAFAAAGDRATTIKFTVEGGQNVGQIGRSLVDRGLLRDALAFSYLAVTQDVDGKLHTGTFNLAATMTPQEILDRLQLPPDPETTRIFLPIRSGLRIEQITALLETKDLAFEAQEFYDLAMDPPAWVRTEFPWLEALPRGRSLEGFLGADSNLTIDSDLTADGFVRVLLADWEKDIGPDIIRDVERTSGKDFYDVLTLASIVEHETSVDKERRKVAGVYTNRLEAGGETAGFLQADPTVSYAVDTDKLAKQPIAKWPKHVFWSAVTNQAKKKVSPRMQSYQTYQQAGLPDGPIDSPTRASILAAANPDTKDGYYFFVACKANQPHTFAKTYSKHLANVDKCRG